MIAAAKALLDGFLPAWRLYLTGAGILIVVTALGFFAHELEQRGAERATSKIQGANDANQDTARKATSAVDLCFSSNGTWDYPRGVCVHAGPGQ